MTLGERAWLWRYRRGWSIAETAEAAGVARWVIVAIEHDRRLPTGTYARMVLRVTDYVAPTECLRLRRRRSGLSLHAAARALGVSHVNFLKRENESCPALATFWRERA